MTSRSVSCSTAHTRTSSRGARGPVGAGPQWAGAEGTGGTTWVPPAWGERGTRSPRTCRSYRVWPVHRLSRTCWLPALSVRILQACGAVDVPAVTACSGAGCYLRPARERGTISCSTALRQEVGRYVERLQAGGGMAPALLRAAGAAAERGRPVGAGGSPADRPAHLAVGRLLPPVDGPPDPGHRPVEGRPAGAAPAALRRALPGRADRDRLLPAESGCRGGVCDRLRPAAAGGLVAGRHPRRTRHGGRVVAAGQGRC